MVTTGWLNTELTVMTAKGLEYLTSEDKERFEHRARRVLTPFLLMAELGATTLAALDRRSLDPDVLFIEQQRVGRNGEPIVIKKARSLPLTEQAAAISVGAYNPEATIIGRLMRVSGIDESLQRPLLGREMDVVSAYRPMLARDRDAEPEAVAHLTKMSGWRGIDRIYDRIQEGRRMVKPGLVTPSAIYGHYNVGWNEYGTPVRCNYSKEEVELFKVGTSLYLEGQYYAAGHGADARLDARLLYGVFKDLNHARKGKAAISEVKPWLPKLVEEKPNATILGRMLAGLVTA